MKNVKIKSLTPEQITLELKKINKNLKNKIKNFKT